MHHTCRSALIALSLAAAALPAARAQYIPPPPARPFPGLINEAFRAGDLYRSAWDIGVNVRVRQETKDDAGFTEAGSNWDFSSRVQDDNNNRIIR